MSNAAYGFWSGAVTLSFYFRARATQGSGPVGLMSTAFPSCNLTDLTIAVADGYTYPLPQSTVVETVVTHVMNSNLLDTWSPPQGLTGREYLTKVLSESFDVPLKSGSSQYCRLTFDGQFGPIVIAFA